MHRRDFLKIGGTGAVAVAAGAAGSLERAWAAPKHPDLAVAHGKDAAAITKAALAAMGGMAAFISKGDVVVIKPNIGWDRTPEQAADTNPVVVATLVQMCLDAGAKTVKVFDRTCNDPRRCYVQSQIEPMAQKAGAEVSHIDDRKFSEVAIPKGEAIKSWPLYREILEADKVINVPIAKHHSLSGLTLSFKNWMGVMGASRGRIHQNIHESLADLYTVLKPTLVVLDAVRILTANGPQGGNLKDVKQLDTIVVGVDQVAVDAFGATLFGMKGSDLGVVAAAARRGLGTMDLDKLSIKRVEAS
jgi:uncharacterized protein (DUF362 family)